MEPAISAGLCPLNLPSSFSSHTPSLLLVKLFPFHAERKRQLLRHDRIVFRAPSSAYPNGSDSFSWPRVVHSIQRGTERALSNFGDSFKRTIGLDLDGANRYISVLLEQLRDATKEEQSAFNRFRFELLPAFIDWNRLASWKDVKKWERKRIGALILYIFLLLISFHRAYAMFRAIRLQESKKVLTEAFMEALIPEPNPKNIREFRKSVWKKTMPKGLIMKKFIKGPGGSLVHDPSFVGEYAWDEDHDSSSENVGKIIESDSDLKPEQKVVSKKKLGVAGEVQESNDTWRERLQTWRGILRQDKLSEQFDSLNSIYAVDFDMKEVEKSLIKEIAEKGSNTESGRALWISKRWWRYRPKLPYTYFLRKLDCSEVAAVVFTEDLKKLYITMKEGFPLEYAVDIPLDPFLFEAINTSGVEVDLLQRSQLHYILKVVLALAPGILILWLIRETMMYLHISANRLLYKKYSQLFDMANSENFMLPLGGDDDPKAMYKEVILGGDVWDILDELMIYMRNPMQFYKKKVKFVRGVLLSGPPGTGKTLFARTLAKRSGMPFVFASGAEFTDSEKSGVARIIEFFSMARRNAPSFVFIDEVDAIAGRYARKDPRSRATFEALLSQLDGEKEKTGIDRFSLKQAVIFICATNRPDELDPDFVRPGRIDRHLYIGLPDLKQRVQIFHVHSAGKKLAPDVDFQTLVFRTVGYSGADIQNLVNEAAIMSVRRGHEMITQQDIIDVLDKQLLEGMGVLLTEEEQQKCEASVSLEKKRLLAVHEAGHILLAHLFPRFDWHAFSQLLPGGKETAVSVFYPREDVVDLGYTTFGYMRMQMVVAHGGRCAESIVFGDITDGGRDDLERITKIAREMVISPSNSRLGLTPLVKRVGMFNKPDSPESEVIKYKWDDPHVIPADMTIEVAELFTRELTRYIEETEELAMRGLDNNRHILDVIAQHLLENSRITGLEVEDKLRLMSPVMFEDLAEPFQIDVNQEGPLPVNTKPHHQPLDVYPAPLHRC